MKLEQTTFPFLREDCINTFGIQAGSELFRETQVQYRELLDSADCRGSELLQEHLQAKLFPPMAFYRALLKGGYSKQEALDYVRNETRRAALIKKEEMRKLSKLPLAYTLYRMGVKSYMRKYFPEEGWATQWIRCDKREIQFNLSRCIYWDTCRDYGCPELCCVYCENDDISFSGLLPKIIFQRSGTLGDGATCCDFHFIKGRKVTYEQ